MGKITVSGIELDLFERGTGKPLLVLQDELGLSPDARYLELLSGSRRVIAPSLPGFGTSQLPFWIDTVDDLSYVCLDLLDRLDLKAVDVVGCSFGGWVAAEMATKAPDRIAKMVLCAPYGVKLGASDKLDIPDVFAMSPDALDAKTYHNPSAAKVDMAALSDAEVMAIARNRETFALLGWEPYLHNPKLRHRLHRVAAPTLFLRGESDGLVSTDYLAGYAKLVPGAHVAQIPSAGHYPHLEQPAAFASHVLTFLNG